MKVLSRIYWLVCGVAALRLFRSTEYACGHRAPLQGRTDKVAWSMSKKRATERKCMACHVNSAITCCFCGLPIYPGEPVALYDPKSQGVRKEAQLVDLGQDVSAAIGCLGWDCCPSGGFFAGHWTYDGFKPAFEGGNTAAAEVTRTGELMIVQF